MSSPVFDALARLDEDLADAERELASAERRVAELRAMRDSVQPFIERYVSAPAEPPHEAENLSQPAASSLTAAVLTVFEERPGAVLDTEAVLAGVRQLGFDTDRIAVKNAIHGVVRTGKLDNPRRGRFTLKHASTPAAAGVEINGELYNSFPREIGATP